MIIQAGIKFMQQSYYIYDNMIEQLVNIGSNIGTLVNPSIEGNYG